MKATWRGLVGHSFTLSLLVIACAPAQPKADPPARAPAGAAISDDTDPPSPDYGSTARVLDRPADPTTDLASAPPASVGSSVPTTVAASKSSTVAAPEPSTVAAPEPPTVALARPEATPVASSSSPHSSDDGSGVASASSLAPRIAPTASATTPTVAAPLPAKLPSWRDLRIARISTNCYAAISARGGSNAGFVVGEKSVLVIDTLGAPDRTERLLTAIAAVTSKPIAALAVTHWHYDHVVGDQKLPKGTPIYADKRSRERLQRRLKSDTLLLGPRSGFHGSVGISDVRVPDRDVTGQVEVDLGGLSVVLAPVSKRALHSVGDMIAWVGSDRVLYTGDLVLNGYLPNLADAATFPWIEGLARLKGVPAEKVVPGHGEPGAPDLLDTQLGYFMDLRRAVKHLARAKMTEAEIVKQLTIPKDLAGIGFPEWWRDNVVFVYREIVRGQ